MADLKIMFWNINNTYDYKVYALKSEDDSSSKADDNSAQETATVTDSGTNQGSDPNADSNTATDSKKKDDDPQVDSLFRARNRENREKIAEVINKINPDIAVLVEYSVGKYELITDDDNESGPSQSATGEIKPATPTTNAEGSNTAQNSGGVNQEMNSTTDEPKSVAIFDRFGPYIYRTNLNRKQPKQSWDIQLMAVDCSDLSDEKDAEAELGKQPFELYCVLWKKSMVKMVSRLSAEYKGKDQPLVFQPRNPAGMIFALKDKPQTKFTLIVYHAPHIKEASVNPPKSNTGTSNPTATASQASTSDNINDTQHDTRVKSIKDLSQLKRIEDAIHSTRKTPVLIAGSFDLDYEEAKFKPLLDLGFKGYIDGKNGKTEFDKKKPAENNAGSAQNEATPPTNSVQKAEAALKGDTSKKDEDELDLTIASDNIFTFNFEKGNAVNREAQPGDTSKPADAPDKPAEQEQPEGIYDFIKEDCDNNVGQALALSNHLPIFVTVRLT